MAINFLAQSIIPFKRNITRWIDNTHTTGRNGRECMQHMKTRKRMFEWSAKMIKIPIFYKVVDATWGILTQVAEAVVHDMCLTYNHKIGHP